MRDSPFKTQWELGFGILEVLGSIFSTSLLQRLDYLSITFICSPVKHGPTIATLGIHVNTLVDKELHGLQFVLVLDAANGIAIFFAIRSKGLSCV